MSSADEHAPAEFGAAYWEDRYRSGVGAGRHEPGPSLVAETRGLRPGRALDAGCGTGGDALWLAAQGWHVTAVDVSRTALDQGREAARAAGPVAERVTWVHADLTDWEPAAPDLDLVSSQYVHAAGPPEALVRRLASWVAPGGTLLVVGHARGHDHGIEHGPARPAAAQVEVGQVAAALPADQWDVVVAEPRTHAVRRPDGGVVSLDDVVVRARRRAPAPP